MDRREPIFIVGCERSGTTLLRLMLCSHPEIGIPPEGAFALKLLPRFNEVREFDEKTIDALIAAIWQYPKCRDWGLDPARLKTALRSRKLNSYPDCVRAVYEEYLAQKEPGKRRWGDKNPAHVARVAELSRLFPDALFIHLVRDGRDVAVSLRQAYSGQFSISRAAKYWQRHVTLGHKAGSSLGPARYLALRYEDLVQDAESSLKRVAEFCGISYTTAMLSFHEENARRALVPQHRLDWHRNTLRSVTGERVFAWKRELSRAESMLFQRIAGSTLAQFGYELQKSSPMDELRILLWQASGAAPARVRGKWGFAENGERAPVSGDTFHVTNGTPTTSLSSPTFLGIGAQKTGTTWLNQRLREHPEIWVPPVKELHYFDRSPEYPSPSRLAVSNPLRRLLRREQATLDGIKLGLGELLRRRWALGFWYLRYYLGIYCDAWYLSLFPRTGFRAVGEITPSYSILKDEDVRRMRELLPDARLIFSIRNPVERAWSHARFAERKSLLNLNRPDEVLEFLKSPAQELRGDYRRTLTTYLRYFPPEQLLIVFNDAIAANPEGVLTAVHDFLGVSPARLNPELLRKRVGVTLAREMPESVRQYLGSRYAPMMEWLGSTVGSYARRWLDASRPDHDQAGTPSADLPPAVLASQLTISARTALECERSGPGA